MTSLSTASTMSYEDSLSSQYLASSISSLSSSRNQSSQIARTYKQAAQLFLTRRLYEALTTIEPIISPATPDVLQHYTHQDQHEQQLPAPIATASKTTRVKVWVFYLTLLNSIIDLGPEEGKLVFGSSKWRELAAHARQGTIWDYVVRTGYQGNEGAVDGEVVVNLATLLHEHMPSQKLNQQRLETYLSASSNPTFDIAAHMEQQSYRKSSNGTDTPRDLNTRLRLLELYTLYVLPKNDEWDYASDFINMSEILDDERREAFLQALQGFKEEKDLDAIREKELQRRQDEEMNQRRREDERRQKEDEERRKKEMDERQTSRNSRQRTSSSSSSQRRAQGERNPPPPKSKPAQKKPDPPRPGLYRQATSLMLFMQTAVSNAGKSLTQNRKSLLRFLLFLMAFTLAFARRDVRERVKRSMGNGWLKVRRTVGMGVKVSYI